VLVTLPSIAPALCMTCPTHTASRHRARCGGLLTNRHCLVGAMRGYACPGPLVLCVSHTWLTRLFMQHTYIHAQHMDTREHTTQVALMQRAPSHALSVPSPSWIIISSSCNHQAMTIGEKAAATRSVPRGCMCGTRHAKGRGDGGQCDKHNASSSFNFSLFRLIVTDAAANT
jgi:hypothetical protein